MPSWSRIARRIRVPLGFAFAGFYVWFARPSTIYIVIGAIFALVGLAVRALASGHVRKNEVLTTTGPYAYTRNPLYMGSIVLATGFLIAAKSLWIVLIACAILLAIYFPVIRSEEAFLRSRFLDYEEYSRRVPRLLPRFRADQSSPGAFSWHLYWKHREYNAAIGTLCMIAVLVVKLIWFTK